MGLISMTYPTDALWARGLKTNMYCAMITRLVINHRVVIRDFYRVTSSDHCAISMYLLLIICFDSDIVFCCKCACNLGDEE